MNPTEWPRIRVESHFGDRVVKCFEKRAQTLYQLLEKACEINPHGIALVCEESQLSYSELRRDSSLLAQRMSLDGIKPGDRIALLLNNRIEFVVALFAITAIGAICVPLSVREQKTGIKFALTHSKASMVIHESNLAQLLPTQEEAPSLRFKLSIQTCESSQSYADWIEIDNNEAQHAAFTPFACDEEDTAIILYTSGTTGLPKGAMLSHFGLVHSSMHYKFSFNLSHTDCAIATVPLSHVTGVVALITCVIMAGAKLVIMPNFKAAHFISLAQVHAMTYTLMVPAMYNLCLLDPLFEKTDLSNWRVGAFGGAPMPVATIEQLVGKIPKLILLNCYGSTETTSPSTLMPKGETLRHLDSVGQALPCVEIRTMDSQGRELAVGELGEIWIKGPMVVKGYWDNLEATRTNFVGGFWRSGDLGSIDEKGYLKVVDRIKDMINRGGYKIYTIEVENVLYQHPSVLECAVVSKPCPVLGERVHAFITLKGELVKESTLKEFCAQHLADYKVPESFSISKELLPRNANGKLLKRDLRNKITPFTA